MEYFLDGYNLLFSQNQDDFGLQHSREKFIEHLSAAAESLLLDLSLIFDGRFRLGHGSLSHYKKLRILYSAFGETADELILTELESHPQPEQVTVVTSDNELAYLSRIKHAKTEKTPRFLKRLDERMTKQRIRTPPPQPKPTPKKRSPLQEHSPVLEGTLFNHYLKVFEKRYEEEYTPPVSPKSDYERWLEAFEDGTD